MGSLLFKRGELVLLLALGLNVYARSGTDSTLVRFTRRLSHQQDEGLRRGYREFGL
jgi:hypothetical protein